jgi:hypothetical protein
VLITDWLYQYKSSAWLITRKREGQSKGTEQNLQQLTLNAELSYAVGDIFFQITSTAIHQIILETSSRKAEHIENWHVRNN